MTMDITSSQSNNNLRSAARFFPNLFSQQGRQRHGSGNGTSSGEESPSGVSPPSGPPLSDDPNTTWGSAYAKCYARRQEKFRRNEKVMANIQGKIPKLEQLNKAIQQGNVEAVRDLVKKGGIDVNAQFAGGSHPLAASVMCSQREICKLLVDHGADCNQKDGTGTTPLHLSVQWNWVSDSSIIDILLEGKADPNVSNDHGMTPLHSAIKRHRKAHVVKFLQRGGNVNKGMVTSGKTPVMLAAESGQMDILRLLAEDHHADLRLRDKSGNTILHNAALSGHTDIVEYLLMQKGLPPNVTNGEKVTPIRMAVSKGYSRIVKLLLMHGAGISLQHRELLQMAAKVRSPEILKLLFQHGAKAESRLVFATLEDCILSPSIMTPSIMEGWLLVFQVLLQATGCLLIDEANDDVLYMACLKSSEIHSSFTSAGNQDDLPTLSKIILMFAISGYPFTTKILNATRVEADLFQAESAGPPKIGRPGGWPTSPPPSLYQSLVCFLCENPRSLKEHACLSIRHCASHISNVFHLSFLLPLPRLLQENVVDLCDTLLI